MHLNFMLIPLSFKLSFDLRVAFEYFTAIPYFDFFQFYYQTN